MGVGYVVANLTKRERISFLHLPVNTAKEICGNPVSAAIVSWDLLQNSGDAIRFVDDHGLAGVDISGFADRTAETIEMLVAAELLEDHGIAYRDADDPESVFIRDVRNRWMPTHG